MSKRDQILKSLEGKKIIIWGARMTGLGALRKLKEKGLNVHCFIDSDTAFVSKKSYGYNVFNPSELKEIIGSSNDLGAFESGLTAKLMGTVPAVIFGGIMTLFSVGFTNLKFPDFKNLDLSDDIE